MGLSPQELMELMLYIQKNNSWAKMYQLHQIGRKTPKYIDFKMDSRTGDIWCVVFRRGNEEIARFRTENGYNLKERVYEWLDEVKEGGSV